MDFKDTFELISKILGKIGSDIREENYDGIIVKKLESSNTLDKGRTTKQSHIAITGAQMDMFPYVRADGYFEVDYDDEDTELKKYFVAQIPVYLHKENVDYLDDSVSIFNDKEKLVHISIVRSRRKDAADQIQMSMTYMDSQEYVDYRRIVHAGSYMIMLKRKAAMLYDMYSVKEKDIEIEDKSLKDINNCFVKLATNTVVHIDELVDTNTSENDEDILMHGLYGIHIKEQNNALSEENPHVCIGWSALGDLSNVDSKDELSKLYDNFFQKNNRGRGQDIGQIWRFKNDIKIGDYIILADTSTFHIGRIDSDYYYDDSENPDQSSDYTNNRKVTWLKKNLNREMLSSSFHNSLKTAMSIWSLNDYKSAVVDILKGTYQKDEVEIQDEEKKELIFETQIKCSYERNRIAFGAPGTGKSYQLKKDVDELLLNMGGMAERVTFHPDYSYSQFVGTYKPVMDTDGKSIRYDFVPGPFMRIYVEALRNAQTNSPEPYILIIEEINRAKVAAVFGDVFQLLDRDDNGVSEYEIQASEDIRRYLVNELNGNEADYKYIKLPNNMFIWATMNSADQGVFPMDTAFKRRWNFEYLGINKNEEEISGIGKIMLPGTDEPIEWNTLRKAINEKMSSTDFKINEDKLMGPFFLSKKVIESNENGMIVDAARFIDAFKSKVIMYLYEDAVKQGKHRFFDGCDSSKYSSVCDAFDEIGTGIFGTNFRETYYDKQRNDD